MARVKALTTIHHDNRVYAPGEEIEMTDAKAEELAKVAAAEIIERDSAPRSKPDPSRQS